MKVLSNLFGTNKKMSANEIALKNNNETFLLDDYLNKTTETVLFQNENGAAGTINLNDDLSNYKYIEIFYFEGQVASFKSVKVFEPNNKNVSLNSVVGLQSGNLLRITGIIYNLSGNKMTVDSVNNSLVNIFTKVVTVQETTTNEVGIIRVVGYKK